MEHEPEDVVNDEDQLHEQMQDTREAIVEKIELLEKKVMDSTVKAVTESVGTILDTTGAVKETVETVKETVHETVNSIKEFLDVRQHTRRHPWMATLGAMVVGYGLERLFFSPRSKAATALPPPSSGQPARAAAGAHRNGGHRSKREGPSLVKGWLNTLGEKFEPEIDQVKKAAMGITLSLLRDFVVQSVPETWHPQVSDTFRQFAEKMNVEITDSPGQLVCPPAQTPRSQTNSGAEPPAPTRQPAAGTPTGRFSRPWERGAQMGEG
jgi:hypothetical protein